MTAICSDERGEPGWRLLLTPRWDGKLQRTQGTRPRMEGVARPKLTLDGYGSLSPGASVSSCEAECPVEGQLCGLIEAALIAVRAKTVDPVEVYYNCSGRKMVASPEINHSPFAIIAAYAIGRHNNLNPLPSKMFRNLSGEFLCRLRHFKGVNAHSLDRFCVWIMSPASHLDNPALGLLIEMIVFG